MTNLYFIRNVGCDDETRGLARMTDEQLSFFKNVVSDLNKNSAYGCMPVIHVYKIDEDVLREANETEDIPERVLTLGNCKYVIDDVSLWYGIEDDKTKLERVI